MRTSGWTRRWLLCGTSVFWLGSLAVAAQTETVPDSRFMARQLEELRPTEGTTQVVIMGDPSKPGMYIVQNTFAPGRMSRPHFHDQDRYITVVKGTWWVALGSAADGNDPAKMVPMKAGSFVFHPAYGRHFDGAKDEEAVVRIIGMGPVKTTQLTPPAGR
jgi:quercetin dioxygenase-like cupin family protein